MKWTARKEQAMANRLREAAQTLQTVKDHHSEQVIAGNATTILELLPVIIRALEENWESQLEDAEDAAK